MTGPITDPVELAERAVAYDNQMLDLIASHGWALQGVFPTQEDVDSGRSVVGWTYTVGSALVEGDPEVVVYGLPSNIGGAVLNDLIAKHRDGTRRLVANGRYDDVLVGFPVVLVEVTDTEVIDTDLATAKRVIGPLLGTRPTVLQLVWPDDAGLFPWDQGYDEKFRVVPLHGTYTAVTE